MSSNELPPIPYKSKMLTPMGFLTEPWSKFFREIFFRLGGNSQTPTGGVDVAQNTTDIADLKLRMEALEQEPVG